MLIKILDMSIPLFGAIICFLLYMGKIPIKENKDDNKTFYASHKKFFLLAARGFLIFCLSILIG